jgi:hypothetical protein
MIDELFALLNLLPLPVWLAMLLFPRTRATERLVTSPWPFIVLGGLSALLLLAALATLTPAGLGLSSEALRSAISRDWGFLAAWSQIIALDLFAGVWIFRDARYWSVRPTPYLLVTLFAGPVGLAAYLLRRRRLETGDPVRTLN